MRNCDTKCERRAFASVIKVFCIIVSIACVVYTCSVLV